MDRAWTVARPVAMMLFETAWQWTLTSNASTTSLKLGVGLAYVVHLKKEFRMRIRDARVLMGDGSC